VTPDGLPEFVLARIAEREVLARAAQLSNGRWHRSGQFAMATAVVQEFGPIVVPGRVGSRAWDVNGHIATWDPARVLAVCEVHRRIVEHEAPGPRSRGDGPIQWEYLPPVLRLLGSLDAEHPDYQKIWKP
jgi:hypothetical protein